MGVQFKPIYAEYKPVRNMVGCKWTEQPGRHMLWLNIFAGEWMNVIAKLSEAFIEIGTHEGDWFE